MLRRLWDHVLTILGEDHHVLPESHIRKVVPLLSNVHLLLLSLAWLCLLLLELDLLQEVLVDHLLILGWIARQGCLRLLGRVASGL